MAVKDGALDNGIRSCADPKHLQQICDSLSAVKIDTLLRKWLARLPHPYPAPDRAAGYRYQLSIWQIELSLTQVLDRLVSGRVWPIPIATTEHDSLPRRLIFGWANRRRDLPGPTRHGLVRTTGADAVGSREAYRSRQSVRKMGQYCASFA